DCLMVLRNPGFSVGRIAVAAKLDLRKAEAAVRKLTELGFAEQGDSRLWLVTTQGETYSFQTTPDRRERRGRPMSGRALARELGFSRERVRQLLLRLHAQGRIAFADPDHPSWLIKRADDESPVLFRDETRVLSALPLERAADVAGLTRATKLARGEVDRILEKLIDGGWVEALGGLNGAQAFRIAAAGLEHPQYVHTKRRLPPPHLPVRSDRVRTVLQTIADAEALRIRDVKHLTK